MAAPRKKRFLKLEDSEYSVDDPENEEDDADAPVDIRDVEFRLRNDANQVKVKDFN